MKNIEIQCMALTALTEDEMQEIDGGLLPLLIIGAAILLAGCSSQANYNREKGTQVSIQCTNCTVTIKNDTTTIVSKQ